MYFSDYETRIGFNDVKTRNGVYFYVQRTTGYASVNTVIPYQVAQLNIGNAMNLTTGTFTAPTNGRYQFAFNANAHSGTNSVTLRVNSVQIANSYGVLDGNLPLLATLNLKKGDTVDTFLNSGSLYDSSAHWTDFSGTLLEEDLVL